MKILQVVAVMAIIALVAGLGARTIMTGMSIAEEQEKDNSEQVKIIDSSSSSDSENNDKYNYEKEEATVVNEVQYLNIVDEGESKSSGGGGSSGSGDSESNEIEDLCFSDSDCNDNNPDTIDSCKECIYDEDNTRKECVNIQPNLYGQVVDAEKGTALHGVNFSIYNSSEFDIFTGEGNYSNLKPKTNPDAVSNENGTYGVFVDPDNSYHMVMQGSDEKEFDINITSRSASMSNKSIILPEDGHIKVYFEKASAALKSDLYIDFENGSSQLLVEKSNVGQAVYLNDSVYEEGTEIKFHINVDGSVWSRLRNHNPSYSSYNHSSDSKYCQVERVDLDTWRLHFEDLPDWWTPDWDFNDAVVLVDIVNASTGNSSNSSINDNDCDDDGIVNWLDYNDSECDFGEENQEIYENDTEEENESGKFNAEGHILFYGKYGKGNKYVCGDKIKFVMFGINKREHNETITFMIEDHTDKQGVNGDIVYRGNISNEDESLTIPNNGTKVHKEFEFEIPCNFSTAKNGKHDIHIMWNNNSRYHKIGNFFVIEDTTSPWINAQKNASGFPNETITISYSASDPTQNGTVREFEISINGPSNGSLTVNIDQDSSDPNNTIIFNHGGSQTVDLIYNESGEYNINLTVIDNSGNNDSVIVPVTVFITEERAFDLALPIYNDFGLINADFENNSFESGLGESGIEIDRYNVNSKIGDEYITPNKGMDKSEADKLQDAILNCSTRSPPFVLPIFPTTSSDFTNKLENFFLDLKCGCGGSHSHLIPGGSCS